MNAPTAHDAESVDDFLARIASLKERREREDEERTRKLEEEIAQGRRERAARRAERARSISPTKSSPAPSLSTMIDNKTPSKHPREPFVDTSPRPQTPTHTMSRSMETRPSPTDAPRSRGWDTSRPLPAPPENSSAMSTSQPTVTSLARSGTLSWQQRPSSRDSESSSIRPFPGASSASKKSDSTATPLAADSNDVSRAQIAQSLGGKDPSWFRQTADRGLGSAAYRRGERQQGTEETDSYLTGQSMPLPGMSRESTVEPEKDVGSQAETSATTTPVRSSRDRESTKDQSPRIGLYSGRARSPPKQNDPLALSASQILEAPTASNRDLSVSIESGRPTSMPPPDNLSSDRPRSPTKGLGGFVESAMMKRSDSVNKRWSVQAAAGLKRGDSVASNRNTLGALGGGQLTTAGLPRSPTRQSRPLPAPSSPLSSSRPTSTHEPFGSPQASIGNDEVRRRDETSRPAGDVDETVHRHNSQTDINDDGKEVVPPSPEAESESKAVADDTLPESPSKTMDSRRWSPTKSSWLESALAKPESPRPAAAKLAVPTWQRDLQKARVAQADQAQPTDGPATKFEVKTVTGLLRSPPLGGNAKPQTMSGLPEGFSAGPSKTRTFPTTKEKPVIPSKATERKVSEPKVFVQRAREEDGSGNASLEAREPTNLSVGQLPRSSTPEIEITRKPKKDPPSTIAKSQTSPKTDFRAGLKSRRTDSQDNSNAEPEFKAVFGKLKRTETKNYVAPDELKGNITRGKAGLNLTGGPQKSKRVDEFKESILQKKEAMKQKHGQEAAATPSVSPKPSNTLPEALVKRQMLNKSKDLGTQLALNSPSSTVPASTDKNEKVSAKTLTESTPAPAPQASFATSVAREKPAVSDTGDAEDSSKNLPSITSMPKQELETSKLAARLNSALAGVLSRSASPKIPGRASALDETAQPESINQVIPHEDSRSTSESGLIHMTKARARGPRRRLPKADTQISDKPFADTHVRAIRQKTEQPSLSSEEAIVKTVSITIDGAAEGRSTLPATVTKTAASRPLAVEKRTERKVRDSKPDEARDVASSFTPKPKPLVVAKSPELRRVSSQKTETEQKTSPAPTKSETPHKFDIVEDQSFIASPQSFANAIKPPSGSSKSEDAAALPLTPSTTKLNSNKSPRVVPRDRPKPAVIPLDKVNGLGLDLEKAQQAVRPSTTTELTPPAEPSPVKKDSHERAFVTDFFDQTPQACDRAEFDAQSIMTSTVEPSNKIKTMNMQMWEVRGDGKKQRMPAQQEHILYEDCMYLCVHPFQRPNGSKLTEVYLWTGGLVSEAAIEDAQLFCRKIARDSGAKMEVMGQGKESGNFFQALGGIVITRRNKSSALYMLCCRKHLGHIALDEVDLDPNNLCSGFPFIVSAKFGKLYLWKGRGSSADELGCARLIGMDLGLTGEIEEVDEGRESSAFWESFPTRTVTRRSQADKIWSLKATQDGYQCRLYRVEHERPKSSTGWFSGHRGSSPPKAAHKAAVGEILPFSQHDLREDAIYVLDAYFQIYVYVGAQAGAKSAEFVTALMLTQEMKILAPSLQDRPMMPECQVVFGQPPSDFAAAFRKWQARPSPDGTILPLEETTEAIEWRN